MESNRSYTVAVVGTFSGTQPDRISRFHEIDRDVLDTVMGRIEPNVALDSPWCRELKMNEWRDFHPNSILERASRLASLLEARSVVGDETQMNRCLERAGVSILSPEAQPERSSAASSTAAEPVAVDEGDLLDSMLGDATATARPTAAPASGERSAGDGFDSAIREIIDASRQGGDPAREEKLVEAIDQALAERLRVVLRHPGFRQLEESWSGLRKLVRAAPTSEALRIFVADHGQARFAAEDDLDDASLAGLVSSGLPAASPGRLLIVTDYAFDASVDSMRQLARLGEIAERTGALVLARAAGNAVAVQDASEAALMAWSELQRLPGSRRIGLVAPRLLARGPYGAETDPIEAFDFEEGARPDHPEDYAWQSGSFALAEAWVRSIAETGSPDDVGRHVELDDLPIHVQGGGSETRVCGPVEAELPEPLREAFRLMGIIPVTGIRGTDRARLLGLDSLACDPLFGAA